MKKNVQWLVIFVFALLLLTGCKGSEQETQKKNGESEDVSSKVETFLKKETNQSSETTQLLTETDASETADMQSTESMTETEVTAWDELQGRMQENDCNIAMAFLGYISYEADEVKIRQYASQEACVQYDFLRRQIWWTAEAKKFMPSCRAPECLSLSIAWKCQRWESTMTSWRHRFMKEKKGNRFFFDAMSVRFFQMCC